MFYLTIPLIIAIAAAIGVAVIVWRKMAFLRKLTPEAHEVGESWLHDMAPEAVDWARTFPWREYLHNGLVEFEKLLRRVRLMFMAVDRQSERLVRTVRRAHQQTAKQVIEHQEQIQAAKDEIVEVDPDAIDMDDPEQLKAEEQRLIVAIAQHPKDAELYSDLAKVSMRMRNYADAVEAMEQATRLEQGNESYLKRLERARRKLIDFQQK
jgi:tetratricopeptide (TPR) repeat protein